jgi:hypothetical protein
LFDCSAALEVLPELSSSVLCLLHGCLQFGQTLVYITPNQGIAQVVAGGLNFLW